MDVLNLFIEHLEDDQHFEMLKKALSFALNDNVSEKLQKRGYRALLTVCSSSMPAVHNFFMHNLDHIQVYALFKFKIL